MFSYIRFADDTSFIFQDGPSSNCSNTVCLVGQIKRGQSLPNRSSTYCILDYRKTQRPPTKKKRRYRYHVHITPYSITLLVVNFEKCCCEN